MAESKWSLIRRGVYPHLDRNLLTNVSYEEALTGLYDAGGDEKYLNVYNYDFVIELVEN